MKTTLMTVNHQENRKYFRTMSKPANTKQSRRNLRVFVIGIVIFALGFFTAHNWFTALPFLPKFDHFLIGTFIAIAGALITAIAVRCTLDYKKDILHLPIPRFRPNFAGMSSLGLAIIFYFFLIFDLYRQKYSHYDILYFLVSIFLFGFSVHKLFPSINAKRERIFNRNDLILAVLLVVLSVSINLIGLDRWNFAFSGDEEAFWDSAWLVAADQPWNFFNLNAAYEAHPMLDSVYPGLFMKLFGINIISWRLSLVFIQAASAVLVYLITLLLIDKFSAIFSGVIVASSHYLMALNRTGYNNNHMVFYISLAVLMLVLAWRTQKTVYVFLTGAALALCLCTYKIATYIWIVLFLVLLIEFCRRPSVKQLSAWALVAIGFLLIISPNLFVTPPSELMRVANQYSGTDARTGNYWFSMSFSSFKNTIGAFWIDHNKGHGRYVHGAFIDIITKSLLILGIALSIMFFSSVECKIALLWFVVGMLIIPFTSYHPNASVTRLMFVIPAIALLSAISVNKIKAFLAKYEFSQKKILVGFIALLVLIVPLNIYQLQVYGPEHGAGIHVLAMIVKAWQEYPQKDIVLVSNQVESRGYSGVTTFLNQYSGVHGKYIYINETESDLFVKENMSNLPIFLIYVNEKDIAANLSKKLPPEYLSIIDYNVDPIIYLLLPNQTTKKDFLTEEILRIFNPIKKYEDYLM